MQERKEIEELLKKYNSQKRVAEILHVSQMSISRKKRKFGIIHDGRISANKEISKRVKHSECMKSKYESREISPYWLGKKQPEEMAEKRAEKMRGKTAWNSGTAAKIDSICQQCGKVFQHPPSRKRKFCSTGCRDKYFSILYSDGRLKNDNNPNFANGEKIHLAHLRGCYANRVLPEYTRGKKIRHNGKTFRSSWEYEYAIWLEENSIDYFYESRKFKLSDGRTYTPDFYIPSKNEFVEIKGYWYENAKEKFCKFKEEYPDVKILIIEDKQWKI